MKDNKIKEAVSKKFKQIVILVEMPNGEVRQILTTKEQKDLYVSLLANEKHEIIVSEPYHPIVFNPIDKNSEDEKSSD